MTRRANDSTVAGAVADAATRAGITTESLALAADIDPAALAERLNGAEDFTVSEIVRIGAAIDMQPSELLRGAA
jgi:plasmid maintenance system antidote protein VapI